MNKPGGASAGSGTSGLPPTLALAGGLPLRPMRVSSDDVVPVAEVGVQAHHLSRDAARALLRRMETVSIRWFWQRRQQRRDKAARAVAAQAQAFAERRD